MPRSNTPASPCSPSSTTSSSRSLTNTAAISPRLSSIARAPAPCACGHGCQGHSGCFFWFVCFFDEIVHSDTTIVLSRPLSQQPHASPPPSPGACRAYTLRIHRRSSQPCRRNTASRWRRWRHSTPSIRSPTPRGLRSPRLRESFSTRASQTV